MRRALVFSRYAPECSGADGPGVCCTIIAYYVVLQVNYAFVMITCVGAFDKPSTIISFILFEFLCSMIFWSHLKCMTTEPGYLPKGKTKIKF